MNSTIEIIRQKLQNKMLEEKRRIAGELMSEGVVSTKQSAQDSINKLQQTLLALQSKASQAKDPAAMKERIDALKARIAAAKSGLSENEHDARIADDQYKNVLSKSHWMRNVNTNGVHTGWKSNDHPGHSIQYSHSGWSRKVDGKTTHSGNSAKDLAQHLKEK